MFDSQNNARGGYNAQGITHYAGGVMNIEWTNQHQCGGPNNNCELVVQYMCGEKVRNGISEKTIPQQLKQCENDDCDTDLEYGMNEDHQYYEHCMTRKRNNGIYTSDQDMGGSRTTAKFTRQDNNGNRYAYECPEERDYYPYWGPTPWKDIVIMTGDTSRCDYYKKHSQNQAKKSHCVSNFHELPIEARNADKNSKVDQHFRKYPVPQTEEECEDYASTLDSAGKKYEITAKWVTVDEHDIPVPECIQSPYSRDNHLGNGIGGFPNSYNWTIPGDIEADQCVLRIRYNISTGEFPFDTDASSNGRNRGNQPCKACAVNLGAQVGLDEWDAQDRGYILTGNPDVYTLAVDGVVNEKFELKLAVNTDQYGRTFQDRTHIFAIKKRPANVPANAKIHTISVRGKRGNIVQTYPATEYDFIPNRLEIDQDDYVHICWSGSDDNPQNNAGQGEAGSDRSNIILLEDANYPFTKARSADKPYKYGHWAMSYPKSIDESTFLGLSKDDARLLAMAGPHTGGDIEELDENGPSFCLGLRQAKKAGMFRYMCTRNNNFTNRGQKACVKVNPKKKRDETFSDEAEMNAELKAVEADMMNDLKMSA